VRKSTGVTFSGKGPGNLRTGARRGKKPGGKIVHSSHWSSSTGTRKTLVYRVKNSHSGSGRGGEKATLWPGYRGMWCLKLKSRIGGRLENVVHIDVKDSNPASNRAKGKKWS